MIAAIRDLRNKPDLLFLRLPNLISLICIVVGVVWLLLLPLNEYSRKTYISENALLPGQVHAYFTGSEQNIFRGYKREIEALVDEAAEVPGQRDDVTLNPAYVEGLNGSPRVLFSTNGHRRISNKLHSILQVAGLKVATQKYEYNSAGITHQGENLYGIIHAPRGDATEAIVLVAAWRTADDELNLNGITLALTLARYFKRKLSIA